jgi:hypothetical protein
MAETPKDVALVGISALSGALTACRPTGGALAFLTMTLGGLVGLYGGSESAPPPLTAAEVEQVVTANVHARQHAPGERRSESPTAAQ